MNLKSSCKIEYRKMYEHSQEEVAKFCKGHVKGTLLEPKDRIIEYRDAMGCERELQVGQVIVKITPEEGSVILLELPYDTLFEIFENF